jgi:dTDP-4-dehydrorhamnose 3,5-epimerase
MIRHRTPLDGAWVVEMERRGDERGWFARTFDRAELGFEVVQANASFNTAVGTLRGMHFQRAPHGEPKLVRVTRGAVFDVAVDLATGAWHGVELSAENGLGFFIPAGMAHGFQTLAPDTEVLYLMGHHYVPEAADGVRWDDPAFGIAWPEPPRGGRIIAERDASWPLR